MATSYERMTRRRFLGLLSAIVAGAIVAQWQALVHAATCTGANPCKACKNCKYCKRCAKDGKTCGTCRKK